MTLAIVCSAAESSICCPWSQNPWLSCILFDFHITFSRSAQCMLEGEMSLEDKETSIRTWRLLKDLVFEF